MKSTLRNTSASLARRALLAALFFVIQPAWPVQAQLDFLDPDAAPASRTPDSVPDLFNIALSQTWQSLSADIQAGKVALSEHGLPEDLETKTQKYSDHNQFRVTIEPIPSSIPLNAIHSWRVRIQTPQGEPVAGADVRLFGGMPLHNHGLPTMPVVSRTQTAGGYQLDGLKFTMHGWWQLWFAITVRPEVHVSDPISIQTDTVAFNVVLQP